MAAATMGSAVPGVQAPCDKPSRRPQPRLVALSELARSRAGRGPEHQPDSVTTPARRIETFPYEEGTMVGGFTVRVLPHLGALRSRASVAGRGSSSNRRSMEILGPYFEEIVKADPAICSARRRSRTARSTARSTSRSRAEKATLPAPLRPRPRTRLFGVFSITVAGLRMYLAVSGGILASPSWRSSSPSSASRSCIFQPSPARSRAAVRGHAVFTVIFGGLLVADALCTWLFRIEGCALHCAKPVSQPAFPSRFPGAVGISRRRSGPLLGRACGKACEKWDAVLPMKLRCSRSRALALDIGAEVQPEGHVVLPAAAPAALHRQRPGPAGFIPP